MFKTFSLSGNRFTSWMVRWALLCIIGQALLPTVAYLRSNADAGLWTEICSVYGPKQVVVADGDRQPTTVPHVDCPLCLHVFNDFILSTATFPPVFQSLRIEPAIAMLLARREVRPVSLPEARAPPKHH
jgi:hypothetical protein